MNELAIRLQGTETRRAHKIANALTSWHNYKRYHLVITDLIHIFTILNQQTDNRENPSRRHRSAGS